MQKLTSGAVLEAVLEAVLGAVWAGVIGVHRAEVAQPEVSVFEGASEGPIRGAFHGLLPCRCQVT